MNDPVTRWFAARGITVLSHGTPDERALAFAEITGRAAHNDVCHQLLKRLADHMKRRDHRVVRIARAGLSDHDTGQVRALGRSLVEHGLVAAEFRTDTAAVAVRPLTRTRATQKIFDELVRLLDGGWLEYYALAVARQVWADALLAYRMMLRLPDDNVVELDLFAAIDDQPVLVECKSGTRYHGQVARFGAVAKALGAGRAQSILVVRHVDADRGRSLGLIHGVTVTAASELAAALAAATAAGAT